MRPEDRESVYWALSELAERAPRDDTPLPHSILAAYREGRLAAEETRRVERLLARNPANRRRLERLAEAEPARAPAGLRRQLLALAGQAERLPRGRTRSWRRALAVAALLTLVLGVGWRIHRTTEPQLPPYEVTIAALTERRDEAPSTTVAAALADSTVTIDAIVTQGAVAGVEVALYRAVGERLERLSVGGELRQMQRQGAVRFTAPASTLVGRQPGVYEILLVVGRHGRLPTAIDLDPGVDPTAALAERRLQVHRLTLRLLADDSADLPDTELWDPESLVTEFLHPEPTIRRGDCTCSVVFCGSLCRPSFALPPPSMRTS